MTENSAIFNARHGADSFRPHRQPAPTAQDCLKRGNGANWRTTRQLSGECRFKAWSFQSQERKFESGAGESSVSGALSARTKVSARREDRRALLPVSGLKCGQSPTGTSEL